jgi:hypothetical protein
MGYNKVTHTAFTQQDKRQVLKQHKLRYITEKQHKTVLKYDTITGKQ